jgi:predicted transposase/invertase (TIGR01784 family)
MKVGGRLVNLEVQVEDEGDYKERSLFYWARMFSSAIKSGQKYSELLPTIAISILDFNLFDCEEYHSEFRPMEVKRHEILTDKAVMHYFELRKLPEATAADGKQTRWLELFKANTEKDLKKILAKGDPIMVQAIEAYEEISESERLEELERQRDCDLVDEMYRRARAERAIREGERKGMLKGKREGERKAKRTIAAEMKAKGIDINMIAEITGLTVDEILKL